MDPSQLDGVSVVLGALAAGGIEGVRATAKETVLDARSKISSVLRSRLASRKDHVGEAKLVIFESEPSGENAEALRPHLLEDDVDADLMLLASELLASAGPTASGPGSVAASVININAQHGGHAQVGGIQNHLPTVDPR